MHDHTLALLTRVFDPAEDPIERTLAAMALMETLTFVVECVRNEQVQAHRLARLSGAQEPPDRPAGSGAKVVPLRREQALGNRW